MEEQENLEIGIGTKEVTKLKPTKVKIVNVKIVPVGEKKNDKVVTTCKHPDKDETIEISSVEYLKNKKAIITGLWLNKDEDELISKGSALAVLLNTLGCTSIVELKEKEIDTVEDERGYLCLKAY